jgi:enoyl-CoA hydratase/carnithine racemase
MSLRSKPLNFRYFNVSFPQERIVQVTLNRPEKLNCIDQVTSQEIAKIWELFDQDKSLWVGIITGVGRAFCTGADLQGKFTTVCSKSDSFSFGLTRFYASRMEYDEQGWDSQ